MYGTYYDEYSLSESDEAVDAYRGKLEDRRGAQGEDLLKF